MDTKKTKVACLALAMIGLNILCLVPAVSATGVVIADDTGQITGLPTGDTGTTGSGSYNYVGQLQGTGTKTDLLSIIQTIINVVIGLVGVIAVVVMIMGGISFITSQGDTNKVTKARNTILYGVVGLIVALLAFAIVNFVMSDMLGIQNS